MTIPNAHRMPQLGDEARDVVTGFKGIVTADSRFLNGCRRLCLCSPIKEDGSFGDERWFDEGQVEVLEAGKVRPNPAVPIPEVEKARDPSPTPAHRSGGDRPDATR